MQAQWNDFAGQAKGAIDKAREGMLTGKVQQRIREGLEKSAEEIIGYENYADTPYNPMTLLNDLSLDPTEAIGWLEQKLGFWKKDPRVEVATKAWHEATKRYQAELYTALSNYPTMAGFDEFMDTFDDIKKRRNQVLGATKRAQAASFA